MRLVALQSVMNIEVVGLLGYLLPPRTCCFPTVRWFSLNVVPRSLASSGSSSRELYLPFRVHPALSPVRPWYRSTSRRTPPRVPFPFATQAIGVNQSMSFPRPTFVSSSAFLTLSTTYSSNYRVGLFHPTATSGICTSGGFPAAKPAHLVGESCPHVVGGTLLPVGYPAGARYSHSAFRALIRAAIRCG
jgi:hypothetical protein